MSFSFLKSLGLGADKNPILLSIHNNSVMAAQLSFKNDQPELIGFNQAEIKEEIMKEGKIYNPDAFQELLKKLLKEAEPSPIKSKSALINIPFELIYPFLKDYSSKMTKDIARDSMYDFVEKNSPVPFDGLSIHEKTYSNDYFTYGVVGVTKSWEEKIAKICKNIGIKNCDFIPEPYLRILLSKQDLPDNFALLSFNEDRVFVSLFHNKILYDSYFFKFSMSEDGQLNCPVCFKEFLISREGFENQFKKDITNVFFVGFPKDFQKHIGDYIKSKGLKYNFINADESNHYNLYKTDHDLITLLGLTENLLQNK